MANSLKISDEPPFTAADPRFREECIAQYNANKLQAATNKSGWATKKTYNPIQWDEASPAPRQLERVAQAEAEEERKRFNRVEAMRSMASEALAEQSLSQGIEPEPEPEWKDEVSVVETVVAPPEPVPEPVLYVEPDVLTDREEEEEEEEEAAEAVVLPAHPDEDARGIVGMWFEGNVRARQYRYQRRG